MIEIIEQTSKQYQHTISAIAAFSTFLAVLLSLYFSRASTTSSLKAYLHTKIIYADGKKLSTEYICVNIINTGQIPVSIPFSFFTIKVGKSSYDINPVDYSKIHFANKTYPTTIQAKTQECFF